MMSSLMYEADLPVIHTVSFSANNNNSGFLRAKRCDKENALRSAHSGAVGGFLGWKSK
jgi:hypothetical protein